MARIFFGKGQAQSESEAGIGFVEVEEIFSHRLRGDEAVFTACVCSVRNSPKDMNPVSLAAAHLSVNSLNDAVVV